MKWEISSVSKEYVPVEVTAPHDPTGLTITFAFPPDNEVGSSTWYPGVWDGAATLQDDGTYKARAQCLVGPNGGVVALAVGSYLVHIKITDNPEAPVKAVGVLKVN